MKIIEIAGQNLNQKNVGLFDTYVDFEIDTDIDENEIDAVCEWVSNTFSHNFIIHEHSRKILAGGAIDNALSWRERWNEDTDHTIRVLEYYHLRCSHKDLTIFLLKYSGEKK